jgi:hypothetical protein
MKLNHIFFIILFFCVSVVHAQRLSLRVAEQDSKQGLAFVNIKFGESLQGVSSDIDGYFNIENARNYQSISLSYVGYMDTTIALSSLHSKQTIFLRSKKIQLSPVEILPGENPALKIIRRVIDQQDQNNPEKLSNFYYKAYHKFIITADPESIQKSLNDSSRIDSSTIQMQDFFQSQHLLISETVSERFFKAPNKSKETILANQVSGLSDPFFAVIGNQLQSFSFYAPSINLLDKNYINPLVNNNLNKYFYQLEDSVFSDFDTTYLISFRPYKGTHFEGLQGQVHISSFGYAIKDVIAEPADSNAEVGIHIQQKYELINGTTWFPSQLNTDIIFYNLLVNSTYLKGIGRSYLRNIKVNDPAPPKTKYSNVVLELSQALGEKEGESFWNEYRTLPLDSMESKTYHVIDSLGEAEHLDQKMLLMRSLIKGKLPIGRIDIDLNQLIHYNLFEGWRIGMGIVSNQKLMKQMEIGTYVAYGFTDQAIKAGGSIKINIPTQQKMSLSLSYQQDVRESAAPFSFERKGLFNPSSYRAYLVEKMVYSQHANCSYEFSLLPHSTWTLSLDYEKINSTDPYQYVLTNQASLYEARGDFDFAEAQLNWRFAWKERIMNNQGEYNQLANPYPSLQIHYTKGFPRIGYAIFNYQKLDLQFDYDYFIQFVGRSHWRISAAKVFGDLPWYKLYHGNGSMATFFLETPFTFGTMGINEFLSDEYISFHFRHDFKGLLFGNKPFVPQPLLITQMSIGQLSNSNNHQNIEFNTLEKAYFESGLMLNSILKSGISNIGIGVMYRWGAYAFVNQKDNFAYKLSFQFQL